MDRFYGSSKKEKEIINNMATEIINRTVRSSNPEIFEQQPFEALTDLVFRINPNVDLSKTPMSAQSILNLIRPNSQKLFFR